MHLYASPVVIFNKERYRPQYIPLCSLKELECIKEDIMRVFELKKNAARIDQLFELLKCLPQENGCIFLVDLVEAPYQTNFEATTAFLAESKNWKVDIHAALDQFLPEFGAIKKFKVGSELDIFMVSTTLRLLDLYTKIATGDAKIVEHSWENCMVNGCGFALLDLNSGTYFGGLESHQSMAGYHHSRPKAGYTMFTATIFSEEEFAERWAMECAEFYPNIAIVPIQTRMENLRVVQMSSSSPDIEEHLARFSKNLLEQELDPKLVTQTKTYRKI